MTYLTGPLLDLGSLYESYWYLVDFILYFGLFYYALTNKKTTTYTEKLGISEKMAKWVSLILSFGMIMMELGSGKNLANVASYAIVFVALIFWRVLWIWLRDLSKDFDKEGKESKVITGVIAGILVLAFLQELFTAEVLKDSFGGFLESIFEFTGVWLKLLVVLAGFWVLGWIVSNLRGRGLPAASAARTERQIANQNREINRLADDLNNTRREFRDEITRLGGRIDEIEESIASILTTIEQINSRYTQINQNINQLGRNIESAKTSAIEEAKNIANNAITHADEFKTFIKENLEQAQDQLTETATNITDQAIEEVGKINKSFEDLKTQLKNVKDAIPKEDDLLNKLQSKIEKFKDEEEKQISQKIKDEIRESFDGIKGELVTIDELENLINKRLRGFDVRKIKKSKKRISDRKKGIDGSTKKAEKALEKTKKDRDNLDQFGRDLEEASDSIKSITDLFAELKGEIEQFQKGIPTKDDVDTLFGLQKELEEKINSINTLSADIGEKIKKEEKETEEEEIKEKEEKGFIENTQELYTAIFEQIPTINKATNKVVEKINDAVKKIGALVKESEENEKTGSGRAYTVIKLEVGAEFGYIKGAAKDCKKSIGALLHRVLKRVITLEEEEGYMDLTDPNKALVKQFITICEPLKTTLDNAMEELERLILELENYKKQAKASKSVTYFGWEDKRKTLVSHKRFFEEEMKLPIDRFSSQEKKIKRDILRRLK